jgi:hypothetical protein
MIDSSTKHPSSRSPTCQLGVSELVDSRPFDRSNPLWLILSTMIHSRANSASSEAEYIFALIDPEAWCSVESIFQQARGRHLGTQFGKEHRFGSDDIIPWSTYERSSRFLDLAKISFVTER